MDGDDIGILAGLGFSGLILYLSAQNALIPKLEQIWIWIGTIGSGSNPLSKTQGAQLQNVVNASKQKPIQEVGAGAQQFMWQTGLPGAGSIPVGIEEELKKLGF